MARMLLNTHGTNGDVLPFVALGAALRTRGHEVSVLTHAPYRDMVVAAGLEHVPIDTQDGYDRYVEDARDVLLSRVGADAPPDLLAHYRRTGLFEQLRLEVRALAERHVPGDTVLIGRHTSSLATLVAADLLGAPSAWVAMTPAQHLMLAITEHLHATRLAGPVDELRAGFGLGPVTDWPAFLGSARRQLGLWPGWFDAAGTATPDTVDKTGFVLHDDAESGEVPAAAEAVLASTPAPVLIACSSGQMLLDEFLAAALTACRDADRPVLLVCRFRELLPDPLPPGVHWFARLPYREVMPRVAAVIHHGGIGTLGRALISGVPQLVLAHSFDQPDTGARLRRLGVAEWLPSTTWTPGAASTRLARLLGEPSYRMRAARLGGVIDPARAAERVAALVESLLPATATAASRAG